MNYTSLAALGALAHCLQTCTAGGTRSLHSTLHRRRSQLALPKSKKGHHLFIKTWALRSTFTKQVF